MTFMIPIKKGREAPFINGHPWVFSGALFKIPSGVQDGEAVIIQTHDQKFVAWGLYNATSQIQVRLYSWDQNVLLDDNFWIKKINDAVALRKDTLKYMQSGGACRLVFSEADGISGITADWYDGYLSVQFTSLALYQRREVILKALTDAVGPKAIYLRTEKGTREAEGLEMQDGLAQGELPEGQITIRENDLKFNVDVRTGHKTGFYLDQRQNRAAIRPFVAGKKVLDLFCYTGGFAINAAHAGAAEVIAIDSSAHSLELAAANAAANGLKITFEKSDAFQALEKFAQEGALFDVIVLDPPKFARSKAGIRSALDGYVRLNTMALKVLKPGGVLVTCSCSGHVTAGSFANILASVAIASGRGIRILEERGQASDHPVRPTCPENFYLKCFICAVD